MRRSAARGSPSREVAIHGPLQSRVDPDTATSSRTPMSDTPVDASKRTWLIASGCAGAVGGAFHRRSLRQQLPALREGQGRRRAGGSGHLRPQAGRETHRGVARQAGVDHAGARRSSSSRCKKTDGQLADPKSERKTYPTPEYAKNEHRSIKPEYLGRRRHLLAPGLLAHRQAAARPAAVAAGRLARRLPVPLPRLDFRHGRPRVQEQARARQPRSARRTCTCRTAGC